MSLCRKNKFRCDEWVERKYFSINTYCEQRGAKRNKLDSRAYFYSHIETQNNEITCKLSFFSILLIEQKTIICNYIINIHGEPAVTIFGGFFLSLVQKRHTCNLNTMCTLALKLSYKNLNKKSYLASVLKHFP